MPRRKTKDPVPIRLGHCGLTNPPEIHRQCRGAWNGHPCSCPCHKEPDVVEAEIVDGPIRVDVEVGSEEWMAERQKGIGASEIAGLLGIAPDSWSSPFNLYWRKVAGVGDERDTASMQWGHELEAVILNRFRRQHPEFCVTPGAHYYWSGRPWQRATPDGLVYEWHDTFARPAGDPIAVVQVKTDGSYEGWGEEGTDDIPPYYVAQVRWEMDVMGVGVAYVPVLFNGRTYREYVVEQNVEDVHLMRKEALALLDRIERGDPPPVDWRDATTRTLKALHPLLEDREADLTDLADDVLAYQAARLDIEEAEQRKALAENRIREALGPAQRGSVAGVKVVTRSVFEVKEHVRRASTTDRLNVTKKEVPIT